MKTLHFILMVLLLNLTTQVYAEEKIKIPDDSKWENTNDRNNNSPQLFQDNSNVYVYSEKQLDNVTISITDMQGNMYHYEVATVPAGMYYAISIESLPAGQYYFCIYQGSNYIIGTFST